MAQSDAASLPHQGIVQSLGVTGEAYLEIQAAYSFFNVELFSGQLPPCLITFQRRERSLGHFSAQRFINRQGRRTDEISLNPSFFATHSIEDVLSTLVHEQAHLWQHHFGAKPRGRYHDRHWGAKMIEVGLYPSSTGLPGGAMTGDRMSHYIINGGPFILACRRFLSTRMGIIWFDRQLARSQSATFTPVATFPLPLPDPPKGKGKSPAIAAALNPSPDAITALVVGPIPSHIGDPQLPVHEPASGYSVPIPDALNSEDSLDPVGPIPPGELYKPTALGKSNRSKYCCPKCRLLAWGRPGMRIKCEQCDLSMPAVLPAHAPVSV